MFQTLGGWEPDKPSKLNLCDLILTLKLPEPNIP